MEKNRRTVSTSSVGGVVRLVHRACPAHHPFSTAQLSLHATTLLVPTSAWFLACSALLNKWTHSNQIAPSHTRATSDWLQRGQASQQDTDSAETKGGRRANHRSALDCPPHSCMQCQRIVPAYSERTANVVMDSTLPALLLAGYWTETNSGASWTE